MDLEKIKKKIEKHKKEYLGDLNDDKVIEEKIRSLFHASFNKVIYDMLGIEISYGQFIVKTWCPSRRDNLPIFNYLRSEAGKAKVSEVIENLFGDFNLVLTDKEKKQLITSYKKEYISKLKNNLDELAEEKAKEDAEALFKQIIEEV